MKLKEYLEYVDIPGSEYPEDLEKLPKKEQIEKLLRFIISNSADDVKSAPKQILEIL